MKYILFGFIAFVLVGSGFIAWHTPETTSVTYERETTTSSSDTEPKEGVPKDDPITEQSGK